MRRFSQNRKMLSCLKWQLSLLTSTPGNRAGGITVAAGDCFATVLFSGRRPRTAAGNERTYLNGWSMYHAARTPTQLFPLRSGLVPMIRANRFWRGPLTSWFPSRILTILSDHFRVCTMAWRSFLLISKFPAPATKVDHHATFFGVPIASRARTALNFFEGAAWDSG